MFSNLFKPIELSGLPLKNRIVMAPMGIGSYNEDETFTQDYIDFIKARAKDTGLIISTGTRVSDKYGGLKVNGIYDDKFIPSLQRLSEAAKSEGARFFLQILNFGPVDPIDPYCPSGDIPDYQELDEDVRPKELSTEQIGELVEAFAQGARRAKEAGCDGVELFGSEDGLLASFMCPHFNHRQDKYGKDLEGRMRFPLEIIARIRKLCGDDFPIGFKYNALWNIEDGIDRKLSVRIAKILSQAKVSYIHEWSFESWEKPMSMFKVSPMPSLYQPRNSTLSIAHMIKDEVDVPLIAVGGILKPKEADDMIGQGKTDMVALGRGLIADELWSNHAREEKKPRPCIRCHVCHNEVAVLENIIKCSVNPDVLSNTKIEAAEKPRKVLIAGGGPAGITAAVYASRRGHDVKLYEKDETLGGKLIAGSRPDFKFEFKDFLKYLQDSAYSSKAEINTGKVLDEDTITRERPEVLLVCIGAKPKIPEIDTGRCKTYEAVYALRNPDRLKGKRVLVLGGGDVGCETALYLKRLGSDVFIVEMLEGLMQEEGIEHNSQVLNALLSKDNIKTFLSSKIESLEDSLAVIKDSKTGLNTEVETDAIVFATGYKNDTNKVEKLASLVDDSYIIGDCLRPRRLVDAVGEGFKTAINI